MTIVRSSVSNVSSLIDNLPISLKISKSRFPTPDLDAGETRCAIVVRLAEIQSGIWLAFYVKANLYVEFVRSRSQRAWGAYSKLGYELKASFALFAWAIDYFSTRLRFLSLGVGMGINGLKEDGLTHFKKGWATGTRTAYLCGRIFDRARYNERVRARDMAGADYFPLYRKGEVL